MDVSKLPIDNAGLSTRSVNALTRAGYREVGDLLNLTEEDLFAIANLGKKSVEEILQKIAEYKRSDENVKNVQKTIGEALSFKLENDLDFETWLLNKENQQLVLDYLQKNKTKISKLESLSARAYNLLSFRGYEDLGQIAFMAEDQLQTIPRMDRVAAHEVVSSVKKYLKQIYNDILDYAAQERISQQEISAHILLCDPKYQKSVSEYVQVNDVLIDNIGLAKSTTKKLKRNGYKTLFDIAFLRPMVLKEIIGLGKQAVEEINHKVEEYVQLNASYISALCRGDVTVLWNEGSVRKRILSIYNAIGFEGLSLQELIERLSPPEPVDSTRIKKVLGQLIQSGVLEYTDYRCFRIYPKFEDYLSSCPDIDSRSKRIIQLRLHGSTLEELAQEYDLTRERVRQIIKKQVNKVREIYTSREGVNYFDEDYYQYLYSTYQLDKKDSIKWLGISLTTWLYLEAIDLKPGDKKLAEALEDKNRLEVGLRLRIKNYLNCNRLYIDGTWVEKSRTKLEELVVKKFCQKAVSFDRFTEIYNDFLAYEDIPYDEKLYYTKDLARSRKNRLASARFVLWKQNEVLRYYDIDGRDYADLLEGLNFAAYENIEISTEKLVTEYPDLMRRYDIHDRYELHDLLKKILKDGEYHNFHSCRTPNIRFGEFNRNAAIFDIMSEMAPVSAQDLSEAISREYGYDASTVIGTYLQPFAAYCHQGIYTVEQKAMSLENQSKLKSALTEDFYYFEEIRAIYQEVVPGANAEEINPFNLKSMGFMVLSRYVVQNYPSLESYCMHLLTCEDMIDLRPYKKRLASVVMFWQKMMALKRSLTIIEYAPDSIISMRKLEQFGITKGMIRAYCDEVYSTVEDNTYFSAQSLRLSGFQSDLYELGFDDWFYANLLISDGRFSFNSMFGTIILYKGETNISISSFVNTLIQQHDSMDAIDLIAELEKTYGGKSVEKSHIINKIQGTEIYYDHYLERFYANENMYYRELEEAAEEA